MDEGHTVDVIYLDFANAFDSVHHRFLLSKIKSLGHGDVVVRWIEAYLFGRFSRVHPFIRGLSAPAPRIWYCSLFAKPVADINHLERIQRWATRLVTSMRHLPYEERRQRLGLHSLQRRRLRDDLITNFSGLLDIDPILFFLPPARHRGLGQRNGTNQSTPTNVHASPPGTSLHFLRLSPRQTPTIEFPRSLTSET